MNELEITAGSRLHFGLLCASPGSRWHYGGIGLMLDQPQWRLRLSLINDKSDSIRASPGVYQRISEVLTTFREAHPILTSVRITALSEVPLHSGLGAGTQLTLAVGTALLLLSGQPRPSSVSDLAATLGRRKRSAIGTFGFDHGGFLVDHGRSVADDVAMKRCTFPEDWRMVLLSPRAVEGLSGETEDSFFGDQPFLDDDSVADFEQHVTALIDALQGSNFDRFSAELAAYGERAGDYYAAAQGGVFSSTLLTEVVAWLETRGIIGAVQSSWGPTVCFPASSDKQAEQIANAVAEHSAASQIDVTIARGLNVGATLKSFAPEGQRSFG